MRVLTWWGVWVALLGCAAGAARLPAPALLPGQGEAREQALERFGVLLFNAIEQGHPAQVLFDDEALRELLAPSAAARAASARNNVAARMGAEVAHGGLFDGTAFHALCIQRARPEPAGGAIGLLGAGTVFDRVLVVAEEPGGGRVAAWAEGTFLYTDQGLGAVELTRVEAPRRDHADLELATCDLVVGRWSPHPVVEGGGVDH